MVNILVTQAEQAGPTEDERRKMTLDEVRFQIMFYLGQSSSLLDKEESTYLPLS